MPASSVRLPPRRTALVGFTLLALAAAGCGGSSTSSSSGSTATGGAAAGSGPAKTGTVSLEIGSPVTSLDPAKGSSFADFTAAQSLYDPLVTFNQAGKIVPDLATSWTTTANGATFHLRSGVMCSDGTPLTATGAATSLQRYTDPATAAPLLTGVIGAGNTAKITGDNTAGTVTVVLSHPYSQLLPGLTSNFTGIICPAGLKDLKSLLTHSDGTGAWVASSEVSGSSYTLARNAKYWGGPNFGNMPSGTVPKKLILKVVADDNTAANLQSSGALDIANYSTSNWQKFKGVSGDTTVTQAQTDTMLVFNETPGHVTDKLKVRLAIAEAIDRSAMNKVLGNGEGHLESNLGMPTYECWNGSLSSLIPSYKLATATKVLKGLNFRIIGTSQLSAGNGTSYLLAELRQAGATATLTNENNEAWVTQLFSGKNDWDLTILGYGNTSNSLLSVSGFFTGAAPPKGENLGDVQNSAIAPDYTTAAQNTGTKGCQAMDDLQKSLLQNYDTVPLTALPTTVVYADNTAGVSVKGFVQPSSLRIRH
ncbi:MAG: ABC transporter substrate-binding protein [Actinomycetota bacterium]|nr:ABC transporter substrate-binding protein [Actinomycetota bacterium]